MNSPAAIKCDGDWFDSLQGVYLDRGSVLWRDGPVRECKAECIVGGPGVQG